MKGLIIADSVDAMLATWILHEKYKNITYTFIERKKASEIVSILQDIQSNKIYFDFIIIPLLLPNSLSYEVARIIHLQNIDTRLILLSGTGADSSIVLNIFDNFIPKITIGKNLLGVFDTPILNRIQNHDDLENNIKLLLMQL